MILCSCPRSIKSRERSERCDERAHGERSEPRSEREYMIQQGYYNNRCVSFGLCLPCTCSIVLAHVAQQLVALASVDRHVLLAARPARCICRRRAITTHLGARCISRRRASATRLGAASTTRSTGWLPARRRARRQPLCSPRAAPRQCPRSSLSTGRARPGRPELRRRPPCRRAPPSATARRGALRCLQVGLPVAFAPPPVRLGAAACDALLLVSPSPVQPPPARLAAATRRRQRSPRRRQQHHFRVSHLRRRCLQRLVEPLWKRHRRGFALPRGVSRGGARLPRRLAPWHAGGSSGGAGRGPALLRITGVGAALADAIPLRGGRHGAAPGPQAGSRDVEGHLRRAKRPRARTVGVARGHALATCSACGPPLSRRVLSLCRRVQARSE